MTHDEHYSVENAHDPFSTVQYDMYPHLSQVSRTMRRYSDYDTGRKVYVGPYLDPGVTSDELRDLFSKYGPIQTVWAARNPPGFAFVTFEDPKDAEAACRGLDGTEFAGKRIRVEVARGPRNSRPGGGGDRYQSRYGRGRSRSGSPERRRRSPSYGASPYARRRPSPGRRHRRDESRSPPSRREEQRRTRSRSRDEASSRRDHRHEGSGYDDRRSSSRRSKS